MFAEFPEVPDKLWSSCPKMELIYIWRNSFTYEAFEITEPQELMENQRFGECHRVIVTAC